MKSSEQMWEQGSISLRDAAEPGASPPLPALDVYRRVVDKGLSRLPDSTHCTVRRGIWVMPHDSGWESVARYQPGAVITDPAFVSTSHGTPLRGNVEFIIHERHGKNVEGISFSPHEKEVLFRTRTRFRVLAREDGPGNNVRIEMEEIDGDT